MNWCACCGRRDTLTSAGCITCSSSRTFCGCGALIRCGCGKTPTHECMTTRMLDAGCEDVSAGRVRWMTLDELLEDPDAG